MPTGKLVIIHVSKGIISEVFQISNKIKSGKLDMKGAVGGLRSQRYPSLGCKSPCCGCQRHKTSLELLGKCFADCLDVVWQPLKTAAP